MWSAAPFHHGNCLAHAAQSLEVSKDYHTIGEIAGIDLRHHVRPEQATPSRVLVCPASCARFKDDPAASVSLAYGCKTVVIE